MGKRGVVAARAKRTSGKSVEVSADYLSPTTGMTKRGRTIWVQMMKAFPVGHFTESDRILLEQYCEAAAQHRKATALLEKEGRYYLDGKGVRRRHPAAEDQSKARSECSMLATKLRITKQAMISPKVAGRAALDAAEHHAASGGEFGDLLFNGNEGVRQ